MIKGIFLASLQADLFEFVIDNALFTEHDIRFLAKNLSFEGYSLKPKKEVLGYVPIAQKIYPRSVEGKPLLETP